MNINLKFLGNQLIIVQKCLILTNWWTAQIKLPAQARSMAKNKCLQDDLFIFFPEALLLD